MKATDLMIGDWVIEKDRVCRVSFNTIIEEVREEDCATSASNSTRYYDIEPIPLTQEILEKNGFEKIEGCVTAEAYILDKGECGEANLIIRRFDFNESFVICTPEDQTARISIGYVHELQHALRLARIKKEIVL